MAKSLFEELGGKYERQGDYLIPCLTVPAEEEQAIGIWGQRHLDYLKQYRKVTYTNLLTSGRLNAYLADINRQAQERFERLIEGMKQAQGITEQLKAENALEWMGWLPASMAIMAPSKPYPGSAVHSNLLCMPIHSIRPPAPATAPATTCTMMITLVTLMPE